MITNEQIKELQQRVGTLGRCIGVEDKRAEVEKMTEKTLAPDFWDDPKEAEKFLKEMSGVKFWVTGFDKASSAVEDLNVLLELEDDDIDQAYDEALKAVEDLELRNMLGEEGDNLGAVLTINSGAGGTEANDWSAMLMRMYVRWAERNGYKDILPSRFIFLIMHQCFPEACGKYIFMPFGKLLTERNLSVTQHFIEFLKRFHKAMRGFIENHSSRLFL